MRYTHDDDEYYGTESPPSPANLIWTNMAFAFAFAFAAIEYTKT